MLRPTMIALVSILLAVPARAQTESVVEIPSRPGVTVRGLLIKPANPVGSVVLLAGGHGNLSIGKTGAIGWGAENQLVRTRHAYAKAGFTVLTLDVAPDLKDRDAVKPRSRWSAQWASDVAAAVAHLRRMQKQAPVHVVGTSRAALTVAQVGVQATGEGRPDALVITAGMIADVDPATPSAERNVGNLGRITQPVLLYWHVQDGCAYTPASSGPRAKALFSKAAKVDLITVRGGRAGSGDPCMANSHHGFLGIDDNVVAAVTTWLKAIKPQTP